MASPNPTRRVLGDLSKNTPLSLTASSLTGSKIAVGEFAGDRKENASHLQLASNVLRLGKRTLAVEGDENSPQLKRQKVPIDERQDQQNVPAAPRFDGPPEIYDCTASGSTSRASSPASSAGSQTLNDTQNTMFTEPDTAPSLLGLDTARAALRIMSSAEIREKATALRLRLRLANYKVRTNQVDLPFDRLEIRSLASPSARLPLLRRTPLPSTTVSTVPDIHIQNPSSERKKTDHAIITIPSSPPAAYSALVAEKATPNNDSKISPGLSTPLLPRQLEGLEDITSSVVKGRAADGLLSLMRQK